MKILSTHQKGFTLIEIIIAITVLSFGVLMVYNAFAVAASTTYANAPRLAASYLAQEGIEIIRNLRDINFINQAVWSAGLLTGPCLAGCQADYRVSATNQLESYDGNAFLGINSDGFYTYDFGATPTIYKRKITISPISGTIDVMKVDVLVSWNYNGAPATFNTTGYLYDWQ